MVSGMHNYKIVCLETKGFIAFYAFIMLLIIGLFGISYWYVSRMTTDIILKESHRIIARNYAQAGIEKVMINILNQYRMGNYDLDYPSTKYSKDRINEEYNVKFEDGEYKIEKVAPYKIPGTTKEMFGIPYTKNGKMLGFYDVWMIESVGKVYSTNTKVRLSTLVKVYRNFIQY